MIGFFNSVSFVIQGLQKQYGPEGVAEQGLELFLTVISKMFDLFQTAYEGLFALLSMTISFLVCSLVEDYFSLNEVSLFLHGKRHIYIYVILNLPFLRCLLILDLLQQV